MTVTGGEARQNTRAGSAPPSTPADDEQPVRNTMAAMFSLEDDLTVAGLNERLATLNGAPDADPGEQVRSKWCTSIDSTHAAEEGPDE
ncbi:hypothetical protein [Streptomyces tunisiensis]|uniref:hypothetical protein n=1 Tax=Streptomyces tunisiensis TaxID=948699 RepID=UPI003EE2ED2C